MKKKPRHFRHYRLLRGTTTLEYVIVTSTIVVFAGSASLLLLDSSSRLDHIVDQVATINESKHSETADEMTRAIVSTKKESTAVNAEMQFFVVASMLCIGAFGLLYLRKPRNRKTDDEANCEVKQFREKSAALAKVLRKRNVIQHKFRDDWIHVLNGAATVRQFMSQGLLTVNPMTSIDEAKQLLEENGFRRIMVTKSDGQLVGVLSYKDINSQSGHLVQDVMTHSPLVADPDLCVGIAISKLLQNRISCLPVVENGILVGLISTSDLLMVLQCVMAVLNLPNQASTSPEDRMATIESKLAPPCHS